ncbi:hypothetical protein B0H19DRAFT_1271138 [Mycena capillaripes]|nr:hypothetical protein B0H19DRAFT_1271138 [Mycena capillaripes]
MSGDKDKLMQSPTSLFPILRRVPSRSQWLKSSQALSILAVYLHGMLVAVHLVIVGIWSESLEQLVVFSLENQKTASFLVTATATTLCTIYSALLVFTTQTLSMRRDMHMNQMLVTTHDTAAAWSGVGSAIFYVWRQRAVPASTLAVFSVLVYLGCILVLHVTASSLISLETFNATSPITVGTEGLPAFNLSGYNLSDAQDRFAAWSHTLNYAQGSLKSTLESTLLSTGIPGLHQGTLYDVLGSTGIGNTTVNATGFNITCGFLTDVDFRKEVKNMWGLVGPDATDYGALLGIHPGLISSTEGNASATIAHFSAIPIVDSAGYAGPALKIRPSMGFSVSSIQTFRCSQSLVHQSAVVSAETGQLLSVQPDLIKSSSTWLPYNMVDPTGLRGNVSDILGQPGVSYIGLGEALYPALPGLIFYHENEFSEAFTIFDVYLIQKLGLLPSNSTKKPESIALHDVENALSVFAASVFWTLGHVPPPRTYNIYQKNGSFARVDLPGQQQGLGAPVLLHGNATILAIVLQARLNFSIVTIAAGLTASLVLLVVSLQFLHFGHDHTREDDACIDGTGILQAMWLYRNHPELQSLLEHVEEPTNDNLRQAAMVKTRLADGPNTKAADTMWISPTLTAY